MEFIELQNLFKTYYLGEIEVPVLRGVSLTVARGEFVALMGTSGSGKTTLMNILGCLDRPTSGEYWLDGEEVSRLTVDERALVRNHKLGFVFQNFNLLPRTSALDNVAMPLTYTAEHLSDREVRLRVEDLLHRFGLGDRLDHEPSQLSGGQQQRVAMARALVNYPPLLFADEPTGNLDSRTSEEVLQILRQLNQEEGITIILVTHDANVARHARRIIRIHDGIIVDDTAPFPSPGAERPQPQTAPESKPSFGWSAFRLQRLLRLVLNGLSRNVMRAALTALGIIIGVAAVIAMMEIGRGSSSSIQRAIANMGANTILVLPGTAASGGVSHGTGSVMTLTPQDSEAVLAGCSAVRASAPVVRARTQVIYGNRNWVPTFIYGTTPDFLSIREWVLVAGGAFSDQDVRNAGKVCLLGQRLVRELFQGEEPLGKEVRVQNVAFRVVGILSSKGANMMGMDQDDILLAPWTTIKFRVTGTSATTANQSAAAGSSASQTVNTLNQIYPTLKNNLYPVPSATQTANTPQPVRFINVDSILAAAHSAREVRPAITQITKLLRERHRIRPGQPTDFNVTDMTEMTKALAATAATMTNLLLAVALISLVVGGVGIMNIMLVTVTERTREIGLRLAVGAHRRNILQQFLAESVVLCFCGGAAGIVVGRGVSYLMTVVFRWPTELSLDAIIAGFAVSAAVGIIFGYYPAWKASRLDPIMALRYE
ncbi:MAG: ATP-binding cassette domain-containing protein [Deltaproteobacteria bacterium]|nr:MAG: ATP-binding cassette domain-containing protein [Deltaproteobacteria bacterium]